MKALSNWMKSAIGVVAALFVTGCHAEVKQDSEPESMPNAEAQQNVEENQMDNNGTPQDVEKDEIKPGDYQSVTEDEEKAIMLIYGPPSMLREREVLKRQSEEEADSKENE